MNLIALIPLLSATLYLVLAHAAYAQSSDQHFNRLVAARCLAVALVYFIIFQIHLAEHMSMASFWSRWLLLFFPATAIGFHLAWYCADVRARGLRLIPAIVYISALALAIWHPFADLFGQLSDSQAAGWAFNTTGLVWPASAGLAWLTLLTFIWTVWMLVSTRRITNLLALRRRQVLVAGLVVPAMFDMVMFALLLMGTRTPTMALAALPAVIGGIILLYGNARYHIFTPLRQYESHDMLWSVAEGVLLLTPQGTIQEVNPALCEMTGYREADLIGQDITFLFEDTNAAFRKTILPAIVREHAVSGIEQTCRTSSGKSIPIMFSGSELFDQSGVPSAIVCIISDISEIKRTEEELRMSEERFRTVADFTYDWEYWIGMDGRYLYVSPSCERITGYSPKIFESDPTWLETIVHPDDREKVTQHFHEEIIHDGTFVTRFRVHTRDGSERWIGHVCQPVYNNAGERIGQRASNRDITEQVQVEAMLWKKEECYRAVVEETDDLITQVDPEGRFTYVNHATERIYGISPAECIGRSAFEFVHHDDRVRTEMAFMTWEQQGLTSTTFENRLVNHSGAVYHILWSIKLHYDQASKVTTVTSIGRDISELKRVEEELRQANSSLTAWVGELEQRTHEITVLSELSEVLQICTSVEEAYAVIVRFARRLFPGDSGMMGVRRGTQSVIEPVVVWGDLPMHTHEFLAEECWALRLGRVHVVDDPHRDIVCAHVQPGLTTRSICVPLIAQGETLGVLHLQIAPPMIEREAGLNQRAYEARQRLAVALAKQVALALANVRLRVTLRQQSIRDPLTGLFNRRYMDEMLERELRRATRSEYSVGIIMLDIDRFKQFNDTYGHDGGDALLRAVGGFLQTGTRSEDIVCRYGGEEFMLILPATSPEDIHRRAEQIRGGMKRMQVQHNGHMLGNITVSLGVALFPLHGVTGAEVIKAADSALYRAKTEGRDQVMFAETLVYPISISY